MLDFRVQNVVPPGGKYFYEVPETRVYFEDLEQTRLEARLKRHLLDNSIPVPENLSKLVRDFMCRRLPSGFCFGETTGAPAKVLTTAEVRNATTRLTRKASFVDAGTARERAEGCGRCALNDRTACPSCTGMVAWAVRAVGGRTTGLDQILGICLVDGVLVPAKVFVADIADSPNYPETCWRKLNDDTL